MILCKGMDTGIQEFAYLHRKIDHPPVVTVSEVIRKNRRRFSKPPMSPLPHDQIPKVLCRFQSRTNLSLTIYYLLLVINTPSTKTKTLELLRGSVRPSVFLTPFIHHRHSLPDPNAHRCEAEFHFPFFHFMDQRCAYPHTTAT